MGHFKPFKITNITLNNLKGGINGAHISLYS